MFGSRKEKGKQFAAGAHTLFDHALEIHGGVRFAGELDIEGTVIGDIVAEEGVEALVRVRDRGAVNGEIAAPKVIVNGHVTGNIYSTKHLELAANAVVNGDVHYHVIEMVKGAKVNGNLVHVAEVKKEKKAPAESVQAVDVKNKSAAVI